MMPKNAKGYLSFFSGFIVSFQWNVSVSKKIQECKISRNNKIIR